METIEPILAAQPFFHGLNQRHIQELAACASRLNFTDGQFLCRAEEEATRFYLILQGRVSVEIFSARRGPMTLQTLGEGDVLGWLGFEEKPYHWHLDARAVGLTRTLSLKVSCLREQCEANHDLGYELMKRYAHSLAVSFRISNLQLMDMFQA
ncbi:MAG: cyclic nucleotide-binding domain-containing protein [Deltaproteobacteria bacterium]|nr:cyclic nucleotide-binding domain-containing protein [Deltaproteobacteria bacterium]